MPETINNKAVFSLLEVTVSIRKTLNERYKSSFWVTAEMNKLNHYSHSGHCYPELVEKKDGRVVAQLKANLWKEDYFRIDRQFMDVLKEPLHDGIKILFHARVTFDSAFGLSLHILDIDPVYSLGELEKEKQESIDRLKKEGVFDLNKRLDFPLLPQRIAVISVETSKGYADFKSMLESNHWGYRFFYMLFPALLQGEKSIPSIRAQLARIEKVRNHFDVVAVIRGGGGDVGLSSYNNYFLARDIVNFPLPVLTGIGHATNQTVTEMVSHMNAITPTALADFLIQSFHNFDVPVQQARETIRINAKKVLNDHSAGFNRTIKDLKNATRHSISQSLFQLQRATISVQRHSKFIFVRERTKISGIPDSLKKSMVQQQQQELKNLIRSVSVINKASLRLFQKSQKEIADMEKRVHNMDPLQVLKRGYSITLVNGKSIRSVDEIKPNDEMETILADGKIMAQVNKIRKTKTANEQ
jgi:exodeoxyribonuclease VII large subunit